MSQPQDFAGRVALITGGASGIGHECARQFVARGAQVLLADIDVAGGEAAARELGALAAFHPLDVTSEPQWDAIMQTAVKRWNRLDVLVNAAGIAINADIEHTTLEQFHRVHAVNVDGVFLGCKAALAVMRKGRGSIINLSSIAGLRGVAKLAAYNSAKGAVRMLTKSIALHCAEQGYDIRCNSLHPSYVDTPMVRNFIAESENPARTLSIVNRVSPMNRMGRAEEVAATVVFLATDGASFINGAEIPIDGGASAR
jgi:NAD(P)-dependent dehydrogenase (short-subunit alcohol dehydrogenase family)